MTLMSTIRHQHTQSQVVCVDPAYTRSTSPSTLLPTSDAAAVCIVSLFVIFFFFSLLFSWGQRFFVFFLVVCYLTWKWTEKWKMKKWLAASRETWSLVAGNETYTHTHTVQARRCCDRGEKEEEEESFSYFFFCLLVTSFGGGNSAGTTSHLTHSRRFITNRHTEKKKKKIF